MGFDIAAGVLLAIAGLRGMWIGFARQVVHLAGLIAGAVFAEPVAGLLRPLVIEHLDWLPPALREPVIPLLAFLGIWLVVWITGLLILKWYRRLSQGDDRPSWQDRLLGAGFGLAKGVLVVALGVYLIDCIPEKWRPGPVEKQYQESKTVAIAHQINLIDRVMATPEFQKLHGHVEKAWDGYDAGKVQKDLLTDTLEKSNNE